MKKTKLIELEMKKQQLFKMIEKLENQIEDITIEIDHITDGELISA